MLSSGICKIFSYTSLVEKKLLFLSKVRTHVVFLENSISFYNFTWNLTIKAMTCKFYCSKMFVLSPGIWKILNYESLVEKNYLSLENFEELMFFLENSISFYNFAWKLKFKASTYRYYCYKMFVLPPGIFKIFSRGKFNCMSGTKFRINAKFKL